MLTEQNGNDDEVVTAIINLVKRIQNLETRLTSIETFLSGKFKLTLVDMLGHIVTETKTETVCLNVHVKTNGGVYR